ncbi:MAG TPA: hypothetical protein PK765_01370 [bacterium]|nr:hypothetical protein [bacterium]
MGDGLVLLGFFAIFMYYIWGLAMNTPAPSQNDDLPEYESGRATTYTLLGLVGLFVGGKMLVSGAVTLAEAAGISQMLIGLTIVAVGTSLPELAASVMAAQRGMADMAVGNVVGSNIFNVFWILGVTAIMEPMPLSNAANTDLLVCLGATFAMFFALSASGRHRITRIEGGVFVAAYIAYTVYLVMRG